MKDAGSPDFTWARPKNGPIPIASSVGECEQNLEEKAQPLKNRGVTFKWSQWTDSTF